MDSPNSARMSNVLESTRQRSSDDDVNNDGTSFLEKNSNVRKNLGSLKSKDVRHSDEMFEESRQLKKEWEECSPPLSELSPLDSEITCPYTETESSSGGDYGNGLDDITVEDFIQISEISETEFDAALDASLGINKVCPSASMAQTILERDEKNHFYSQDSFDDIVHLVRYKDEKLAKLANTDSETLEENNRDVSYDIVDVAVDHKRQDAFYSTQKIEVPYDVSYDEQVDESKNLDALYDTLIKNDGFLVEIQGNRSQSSVNSSQKINENSQNSNVESLKVDNCSQTENFICEKIDSCCQTLHDDYQNRANSSHDIDDGKVDVLELNYYKNNWEWNSRLLRANDCSLDVKSQETRGGSLDIGRCNEILKKECYEVKNGCQNVGFEGEKIGKGNDEILISVQKGIGYSLGVPLDKNELVSHANEENGKSIFHSFEVNAANEILFQNDVSTLGEIVCNALEVQAGNIPLLYDDVSSSREAARYCLEVQNENEATPPNEAPPSGKVVCNDFEVQTENVASLQNNVPTLGEVIYEDFEVQTENVPPLLDDMATSGEATRNCLEVENKTTPNEAPTSRKVVCNDSEVQTGLSDFVEDRFKSTDLFQNNTLTLVKVGGVEFKVQAEKLQNHTSSLEKLVFPKNDSLTKEDESSESDSLNEYIDDAIAKFDAFSENHEDRIGIETYLKNRNSNIVETGDLSLVSRKMERDILETVDLNSINRNMESDILETGNLNSINRNMESDILKTVDLNSINRNMESDILKTGNLNSINRNHDVESDILDTNDVTSVDPLAELNICGSCRTEAKNRDVSLTFPILVNKSTQTDGIIFSDAETQTDKKGFLLPFKRPQVKPIYPTLPVKKLCVENTNMQKIKTNSDYEERDQVVPKVVPEMFGGIDECPQLYGNLRQLKMRTLGLPKKTKSSLHFG